VVTSGIRILRRWRPCERVRVRPELGGLGRDAWRQQRAGPADAVLAWRAANHRAWLNRTTNLFREGADRCWSAPFFDGKPLLIDRRRARYFWSSDWAGKSFAAIGMKDPVLGVPAMVSLRATIRNCPPHARRRSDLPFKKTIEKLGTQHIRTDVHRGPVSR
jgi:hypothetical protein